MASKPPEVLWRDATANCAHIYWRGFVWYFGWKNNRSGVYCFSHPAQCRRMPTEVYLTACGMARDAMSNHALRDEMQLRAFGRLDDAKVTSLTNIVRAQLRQSGNPRLTEQNVWEATKSSLGVLGTPGNIRAVAMRLMEQQRAASVQANESMRKGMKAKRSADDQYDLFPDPFVPLLSM